MLLVKAKQRDWSRSRIRRNRWTDYRLRYRAWRWTSSVISRKSWSKRDSKRNISRCSCQGHLTLASHSLINWLSRTSKTWVSSFNKINYNNLIKWSLRMKSICSTTNTSVGKWANQISCQSRMSSTYSTCWLNARHIRNTRRLGR